MFQRVRHAVAAAAVLLSVTQLTAGQCAASEPHAWPASSVIYTLFPSIFSPTKNLAGVTAQLGRLQELGITDLWLMPITPVGKPVNGHPSYGSPYAVHDYFAINPDYGSATDFKNLVKQAHARKIRVILDEVLNHTAWDNPLITQHPEFYVHSDSNVHDPNSVQMALTYGDVAQLDYSNPELRNYIIGMLAFWVREYHVDGFRFDSANNPEGPTRKIPADFWQELGTKLRTIKPDILLLGEESDPELAMKPFNLDYGWPMVGPVENASKGGDASQIQTAWERQRQLYSPNMRHMAISDDWDYPRGVNRYDGPAGALSVEAFYLTATAIPLIYNGMEIGNAAGGVNPHAPIVWTNVTAGFPEFFHQMIRLRRQNPAFQDGAMTWLTNSQPKQLLTYTRTGKGKQFLVEINISPTPISATIDIPINQSWKPVPITGVATAGSSTAPPTVTLPAHGFAIYERNLSSR